MIKEGLVEGAREHLQLIVNNTVEKDKEVEIENFIILSLYNSIINKVFDVKLLYDNNQHDSIEIIIRTIFEQYAYLKFILLSNTKVRAEQFYYSYKIQSAKKGKTFFNNFVNNQGLYGKLPELDEKGKKELGKATPDLEDFNREINTFLDKFKSNIEYDPDKNDKRFYEKWYKFDKKVNNLKDLINIKEMDIYEAMYEIIYAYGSMSVHGIDVPGNVIPIEEGTMLAKNINESSNRAFVGVMLMETSKLITNHYELNKNNAIRSKLEKMRLSYKLK